MKNIFTQGPSLISQLILSLVLASVIMALDYRSNYLDSIRKVFSTLLTPVYYLANIPDEIAAWTNDNIVSRSDLLDQNRELRDELLILKSQNQRLVGLESENARLRALLNSSRNLRGKRLIAEVLNVDASRFTNGLLLNKGTNHGVFVGQAVVDADGLMGQITEVSTVTSRMILLNDPKHAIPVRDDRNGVRAIAQGNGQILFLRHLPNTVDIREGDLLLSSGFGEKFPDGYPVAKVISVTKQTTQPYAEILAEPTANISTSDHVLLLWPYLQNESIFVTEGETSQAGTQAENQDHSVTEDNIQTEQEDNRENQ